MKKLMLTLLGVCATCYAVVPNEIRYGEEKKSRRMAARSGQVYCPEHQTWHEGEEVAHRDVVARSSSMATPYGGASYHPGSRVVRDSSLASAYAGTSIPTEGTPHRTMGRQPRTQRIVSSRRMKTAKNPGGKINYKEIAAYPATMDEVEYVQFADDQARKELFAETEMVEEPATRTSKTTRRSNGRMKPAAEPMMPGGEGTPVSKLPRSGVAEEEFGPFEKMEK